MLEALACIILACVCVCFSFVWEDGNGWRHVFFKHLVSYLVLLNSYGE